MGDRWRVCVDVLVFVRVVCALVFHAETFGIVEAPVGGKKTMRALLPSQKSSLLSLLSCSLCWELFELVIQLLN